MFASRSAAFLFFLILATCAFPAATAAEATDAPETSGARIAVAASGSDENAVVSQRTARAAYILFFDKTGNLVESHANPVSRDRGAGPAMAAWLAENHVDIIIGGAIGPRMGRALAARQIDWVETDGPVSGAVKSVLR